MLFFHIIQYKILNLIAKIFIRNKFIPKNLIKKIKKNKNNKIIYVFPKFSKLNLIILRKNCFLVGLPDPFNTTKIKNLKLPNCIFIQEKKCMFYTSILDFSHRKLKKISKIKLKTTQKIFKKNIYFILTSFMFGRSPKKTITKKNNKIIKKIKKIFHILWYGSDTFIYFSKKISLKKEFKQNKCNKIFIKKLLKIAKIYFIRNKRITLGSEPIKKKKLFKIILKSKKIKKFIKKEKKIKKISTKKTEKKIIKIIKKIHTKFSYEFIRISDRILNIILNQLYEKIYIKNIHRVINLSFKKYKIIYLPSHRSHIDYLLLSFVLYHNGLAPPYIAAGMNLNFFPLGTILRRIGAFFIQRTFSGKKLFSIIFQKYFEKLLQSNFSIEYFIEGKRSRTGFLLKPQTGILSLILKTILKNKINQIALIPIYMGYDSILEISSYQKEKQEKKKKKENFLSIIKSIKKIQKSGQSFVNFGKPILLKKFTQKNIYSNIKNNYPTYFNKITKKLSKKIMIKINNSVIVNSTNLCSLILLSTKENILTKTQIIKQIKFYLKILQKIPYSNDVFFPETKPKKILKTALKLKKIKFIKKEHNIVFIPKKNKTSMNYYKNNILHILVLPSLLANILLDNNNIQYNKIYNIIILIFPLLKKELNIQYPIHKLSYYIKFYLNEFIKQKIIFFNKKEKLFFTNYNHYKILKILSLNISNLLIRYSIIFFFLKKKSLNEQKNSLKRKIFFSIKKISKLHKIDDFDFTDKEKIFFLMSFFSKKQNSKKEYQTSYKTICNLIPNDIPYLIKKTSQKK